MSTAAPSSHGGSAGAGASRMSRFIALKKSKAGCSVKITSDATSIAAATWTPEPAEAVESIDTGTSQKALASTDTQQAVNEWGSDSDREGEGGPNDDDAVGAVEISILERASSSHHDAFDDEELRRRALLRRRTGRKWKVGSGDPIGAGPPTTDGAVSSTASVVPGDADGGSTEGAGEAACGQRAVAEASAEPVPGNADASSEPGPISAGAAESAPPAPAPTAIYRARGPSERTQGFHRKAMTVNIESTADFPDLDAAIVVPTTASSAAESASSQIGGKSLSGVPGRRPVYRPPDPLKTLTETINAKKVSGAGAAGGAAAGRAARRSPEEPSESSAATDAGAMITLGSNTSRDDASEVAGAGNSSSANFADPEVAEKMETEAFEQLLRLDVRQLDVLASSSSNKIPFNIERSREKYIVRPPYSRTTPQCTA